MHRADQFIHTVAAELNNLVSAARSELEALDVDIHTISPSGRDYTIWDGWFAKYWPGPIGFEQAKVTITLLCMVPLKPAEIKDVEVSCRVTAEIFQIGKFSRVYKTSEDTFLLEQLRSSGIRNILLEKIERGRKLLMSPENWH
jgi:hypothetical protein